MNDQALQQFRRAIERQSGLHATIQWTLSQTNQTLTHPGIQGPWQRPLINIRRVAPSCYPIEAAVVHAAASLAVDPGIRIQLVHVPALPADLIPRLTALLQPFQNPKLAVAVVSDAGGAYLHLPPWQVQGVWPDDAQAAPTTPAQPADWSYTDASQWALKLLLLGPLQQSLWWQPPASWDGWVRSGPDLAREAGITPPSAYNIIRGLTQMDWIAHRRGLPIRLTRPEHLLADWLLVARRNRRVRIPVRPLFQRRPADDGPLIWVVRLASQLPTTTPWAVGGWAACMQHQVDISTDAGAYPVHLAVAGDQTEILNRLECAVCEPAQAIAHLEVRTRRHAFQGVVVKAGIPTVDLVQAALDVASDPARGLEQAEHIVDLVVAAYRKARPATGRHRSWAATGSGRRQQAPPLVPSA